MKYLYMLMELNADKFEDLPYNTRHHMHNFNDPSDLTSIPAYIRSQMTISHPIHEEELNKLLNIAIRTNKDIFVKAMAASCININYQEQDMNSHDKEGTRDTPLHWAVRIGNIEIVRTLLNAGADPYIKNKAGFTPIFYSLKKPDIFSLIADNYPVQKKDLGNFSFALYEQALQNNDSNADNLLKLAVSCENEDAKFILSNFKTGSFFTPSKENPKGGNISTMMTNEPEGVSLRSI